MRLSSIEVLALAGLIGLLAGPAASAQDAQVHALFEQARPHVEAVIGRRVERPLRLRAVTLTDLLQVPDPELAAQIVWQFPDLHGDRFLGTAFRAAKEASCSTTSAVTDPRSGEILWQPQACRQMATWNVALARADSPSFLQLALVHAVVVRYLDQTYHLSQRWQQCKDAEEFQVLQTVRAGRALWLTRQVAKRLGTEAHFPLLLQCYRYVPEGDRENRLKHVCHETLRRKHLVGAEGLAFCEYLEEQRLPDVEKRLFESPPRQLAWLGRPELYVKAQQSERPSLAAALQRLESTLPATEWNVSQQPWTPAMVRQVASLLGQQRQADKALRSWEESRTLLWVDKRDPNKQVALSVVRFENEAGARSYYGFANDLQRKRDEAPNAPDAGMLRVLESRMNACTLASAAEAVRFEKVLQLDSKSTPLTEKKLLVRSGDTVVELAWYGMADDPAWADRILATLLKPERPFSPKGGNMP